jgi:4,5-DOPA dioxygenase extradiol
MNALEHNSHTETWSSFGSAIGTPKAALVISAHWFINATAVTHMSSPRTIHDFYGFPEELARFDYPAPGDPALAERVADVVKPTWVGLDSDSWGLDHGTWSVLTHVFPGADVPVLQLSINANETFGYHFDLGARLAPLMGEEVLVLGSGNVVHNLGRINWGAKGQGFDWAHRFDDAVQDVMTHRPEDIGSLVNHPDFHLAVPTPDHFLPLVYIAGLASGSQSRARVFNKSYEMGSLSMTSYAVERADS